MNQGGTREESALVSINPNSLAISFLRQALLTHFTPSRTLQSSSNLAPPLIRGVGGVMQGVTAIAIASSTLSPLSKVRCDRKLPSRTEKAIALCLVCEGDRSTNTLLARMGAPINTGQRNSHS
jgi:hypothetical protein